MIRLRGYRANKTWALHVKPCADVGFGNADTGNVAGWTWRDAFECWGANYVRSLGYIASVPEHPMMRAGAVKTEAA